MKWLINYIRSCFCNHKWELFREAQFYKKPSDSMPVRTEYIFFCKECGSFKKITAK